MKVLEPNKLEFRIASTIGILKKCPFCGSDPVMFSQQNEETHIYCVVIGCTNQKGCFASLQSNDMDRGIAQGKATERWNRRVAWIEDNVDL